ncbi:hypothetical protein Q5752_004301 [Cryptotrichosporon argae]
MTSTQDLSVCLSDVHLSAAHCKPAPVPATAPSTAPATAQGPLERHIVVLGAGVVGLTSALVLARRGYRVEVVARELPGVSDASQDWASPWAGANWTPFVTDPRICAWEVEGLRRLEELIPTGLAMKLPVRRFAASEAGLLGHWYEKVVKNYRRLEPSACPPNAVGVAYDSVSVNAPYYTQWLQAQCAGLGVTFARREVSSLGSLHGPGVLAIVNATGLGAGTLADVADPLVEPIRGQVVLVRAPTRTCTMDASNAALGPTRSTYVIPRPNSGEHVICGGCYEVGSTERVPSRDMTRSILAECLKHHPELATTGEGIDGVDIVRECVGFRPSRKGGPRLERDDDTLKGKCTVVHAYGIGPAGFQASWGMAAEVAAHVADVVTELA